MLKIAKLNNSGLSSRTKVEMLEDFLRRQEIDIIFLQEVAHCTIDTLCSYMTYTNVGTAERDNDHRHHKTTVGTRNSGRI